ncbi:hypothetical protein JX266_003419 [Neoarthrinium moseri]|nr:hypothetical protein JX266_003419 [Neoarthrinium moseri]
MATLYPAETNAGVVTSWVPLATVYTPSVGCSSQYRLNGPSLVAFDPGYGLDIDSRIICQPPAVTTWWEQGRLGSGNDAGHTAVSLGPMTCPDKWITVASSVQDESSTIAMCCPSGYSVANGRSNSIGGDCRSTALSGMVLTYASTSGIATTSWSTATTTLTRNVGVGAIAVVGWNIKQTTSTTTSSDVLETASILVTDTQGSAPRISSGSIATSTEQQATGAIQTSASTDSQAAPILGSSGGLSAGSSIGIGVGVAVGFIGIVALLIALYMVRNRRRRLQQSAAADPPPEVHTDPMSAYQQDPPMQSTYGNKFIYEASDHSRPADMELDGTHGLSELPGSR